MSELRSMFDPETVFYFFAGVWVILGLSFGLFLYLCKDVKLKRKIFAVSVISAGILFIVFMFFWPMPGEVFIFTIAIVVVITVVNLRITKFCDDCGKMVVNQNPFSKPKFCSKCGAVLHS